MYVTLNALDQCLPSLQAPELRYVNVFFMYNTEQLSSKLGLIDQETWTDINFIVGKSAISFGKKMSFFFGTDCALISYIPVILFLINFYIWIWQDTRLR